MTMDTTQQHAWIGPGWTASPEIKAQPVQDGCEYLTAPDAFRAVPMMDPMERAAYWISRHGDCVDWCEPLALAWAVFWLRELEDSAPCPLNR
jgi:hypothetical protein